MPASAVAFVRPVAFGTFEFDPRTGELRKRGLKLRLQPKCAAVLCLLIRHATELVTREQLRMEVWGADTFVDFENGLGNAVWKLRQLLGDTADNPVFIECIPGKGYRFLVLPRPVLPNPNWRTLIAIHPFENLGQGSSDDYFVAGLTEELITQLGRLNPKRLGVIAWRDKPVDEVPSKSPVEYVVTGTVRRDRKRLRVTAHLLHPADQHQVWAGSYDRSTTDAITMQIELAEQIAKSITVELIPVKSAPGPRKWTENSVAYEFYLQGRYHWNKRTPEATLAAIEYFQRAIATDPDYALAHVGLADCFGVLGFYGNLVPADAFGRAKQHASQALTLDDSLAEAHSSLAFSLVQFDWDWSAAQREHLQAIRLNANCSSAHHWYGLTLTQVGRFPEALRSLTRAKEIDPFNPAIQAHIGRLAYFARDFEQSLKEVKRAVELDRSYAPGRYFQALAGIQNGNRNAIEQFEQLVDEYPENPILVSGLAYAYGKTRKRAAALKTIDRLQALAHTVRVPPYFQAFAYTGVENSAAALEYLDQANAERFAWMHYLKMDPVFDFLRANPRFEELAR